MLAPLDVKAAVLAAVRRDLPATESTDLIRFAPQFPQPMYELIRDYFQDVLLPGMEHVPPNSIALLETNQSFIEAYMVGLNHEMSRELLWRGYPTDQRGTYFRQFWDVRGNARALNEEQREQLKDITAVATWTVNSNLGEHGPRSSTEGQMVLLIRGDLLLRYPRAMVYAVEAVWSEDKTRRNWVRRRCIPAFAPRRVRTSPCLDLRSPRLRCAAQTMRMVLRVGSSFCKNSRPNHALAWMRPRPSVARRNIGVT